MDNNVSELGERIGHMRRMRKEAERDVAFKVAALCVLAMGLGAFGFLLPTIGVSLWAGRMWMVSRRELLKMDIEIAMAELEGEKDGEKIAESEREAELARAAAEIAGIEFSEAVGRYDGAPVYGKALKDGRRYLYAGLAGPADEPGPKTLIVNGMLYQMEISGVA